MNKVEQRVVFFLERDKQIRDSVSRSLAGLKDCYFKRFKDANYCINQIRSNDCSLLIIDLSKSEKDGFELLKKAKMLYPQLNVILVAGKDDIPTAVKAIKEGAADYIVNPGESNLLPSVESILKTTPPDSDPAMKILTKTERIILRLIGDCKTNKEIAKNLKCSVRTVENHRHRFMRKLKVRNSVELMKKAINMGFASPD